jgi:hypothetical protein
LKQSFSRILGTKAGKAFNENGKALRNFAAFNELKITTKYFRHTNIHKYTWSARGTESVAEDSKIAQISRSCCEYGYTTMDIPTRRIQC